jgi:hypothetical protein
MMRSYDNQSVRDGYGDGGERFHIVTTSLVERGWNAAENALFYGRYLRARTYGVS